MKVFVAVLCLAGLVACRGTSEDRKAPVAAQLTGCIEHFDAGTDYFPDKIVLQDARNFSVEYHRSFKVVTVFEPFAGGSPEKYVLLQCGAPRPTLEGDNTNAQVVQVPITSLFSGSTTHLALLDELGRMNVLTGVERGDFITTRSVIQQIKSGHISEFAPSSVIDAELVIAKRPSMLMAGGSFDSTFSTIRSAGVPVVANAEWLEPTALARAEWLKYMAVFLNEEKKAQARFAEIKARYLQLSARATATPETEQPTVMTGIATRGTYFSAGGRSYVAALIKDAGGRYIWADNTDKGTVTRDLEAELRRSASADIWINGGGWRNLEDMVRGEPRYKSLKAYRAGQVWVYERQMNAAGGNDYYSRAVTRPDLVLADLVKIFHPGLVPDHEFEWYMQVPAR